MYKYFLIEDFPLLNLRSSFAHRSVKVAIKETAKRLFNYGMMVTILPSRRTTIFWLFLRFSAIIRS